MPRSHGVIFVRGDIKRTYDCDRESGETADRLMASAKLLELNKALASPPPPDPVMPEAKTSKTSTQLEDSLCKMGPLSPDEPSRVAHVKINLDLK
jgi:hypothetical protein